jgi:hypothetical protein
MRSPQLKHIRHDLITHNLWPKPETTTSQELNTMPMHDNQWGTYGNSWKFHSTTAKLKPWSDSSTKLTTPRCLFLSKDTIIVLYTDDCLLYAQDTKDIESFVKTLHDDYKITLNDTDPIDDVLGIHFLHQDNGELHMSQTGLIDAVPESAHIPKGQLKNTPTPDTSILHADTEGLA